MSRAARDGKKTMVRAVVAIALLVATASEAAVIEVRRNSIIREGPDTDFAELARVEATPESPVNVSLVGLERENGFYRVFVPDSSETGWIPKGSGRLRGVEPQDTIAHFERNSFGGWIDADRDCQNTRNEVLIRDADGAVGFRGNRECAVESGLWIDPFTGEEVTNPSALHIDHLVPLENAFLSGAWNWTLERRRLYANFLEDPMHLIAVDGSENTSKGSRAPDEYLPPNADFHCDYASAWLEIKRSWGLRMTVNEAEAVLGIHYGCIGLPE